MSLQSGTRLGPYEVLAPLGAGGMGEVYRARDARVDRVVALKVLPEEFFESEERRRRFEREAKLLASLNHPGIATLYSFEEVSSSSSSPTRHVLAMELVEGRTLRGVQDERLAFRRILDLAVQIAEALAAAHDAGIVHRDLKPENVMVTKGDRVKILDFGLAKRSLTERGDSSLATASVFTEAGSVVGTVAYMSPEQASGHPVDFRSDQFAFGSIFYEMLAGKRAFSSATPPQTLAAIIEDEPRSLGELAPKTPAPVRWVVERCLAKNPEQRYASTKDLASELRSLREHAGDLVSSGGTAAGVAPRRYAFRPLFAGLIVLTGLAAAFVAGRKLWPTAVRPLRFEQITFGQAGIWLARFAPDGSVVFSAPGASRDDRGVPVHELFSVRPGTPEARPLAIAGNILAISRSGEMAILLTRAVPFGPGTLAVAPLGGGTPREVLEDVVNGADWSRDGKSLAVLHRVEGKVRLEFPIGHALRDISGHSLRISPDGKIVTLVADNSISAVDLEGHVRVLGRWPHLSGPEWSPDGRSLWITRVAGSVTEFLSLDLDGTLRTVASVPGGYVMHDLSADGRILAERFAYWSTMRAGGVDGKERDLGWLDEFSPAGLSEDGKLLLFHVSGAGGGPSGSVYVRGTDGSPPKRIARGLPRALSPDGRWALCAGDGGLPPLTLVPTGAGEVRTLDTGAITRYGPGGFHPDGTSVWFNAVERDHSPRCYVQSLAGGPPRPLPAGVDGVQAISPDGSLLAVDKGPNERPKFITAESGVHRPVPESEPGEAPIRWSGDGRSLFVQSRGIPVMIHRIHLATGRREKVMQIDPAETNEPEGVTILVSGDGRSWVYGAQRFSSDLFVIEGLK